MAYKSDGESVALVEKNLDKRPMSQKFTPIPDLTQPKREILDSFTCPACNQECGQVISYNGRVRGWCGVAHIYINQSIKEAI